MGKTLGHETRINYLLRMPDRVREEIKILAKTTRLSEHGQCLALLDHGLASLDRLDFPITDPEEKHSRVTLRLPAEVHASIKAASQRTGTSMNRIINGCLYASAIVANDSPDMDAYLEFTLASHLPDDVFMDLKGEAKRSAVSLIEIAARRIHQGYAASA